MAFDLAATYERQVETVYRVCRSYLRSKAEAEDATQDVFLKALRAAPAFTSLDHERAWFLRVAINHCKDVLKSSRSKSVPLDEVAEPASVEGGFDHTLEVVLALNPPHKDVVYLYYYEGYTTDEIAALLMRPPSTIRSYLSEARKMLRAQLGGDWQ